MRAFGNSLRIAEMASITPILGIRPSIRVTGR
jgi:hypothetical protein